MDLLRKKGPGHPGQNAPGATRPKALWYARAARTAKTAVMATLCCETDFVAKSDDFVATAKALADYALACPADEGVDNLLETSVDGKTFNDILTEVVSKTGEKTQVGDYAKYSLGGAGLIGTYIHFNDKVGTMLQIETSDEATAKNDALRQAATDIAMHITATKPIALDKDQIDPGIIEREKAIFAEQVKGKPENIIGKIRRWQDAEILCTKTVFCNNPSSKTTAKPSSKSSPERPNRPAARRK